MGSSSSSTAAAATAASSSSNNQNPYAPHHHQYYPARGSEYSGGGANRYFDEYCYGGASYGAQYSGQSQQTAQQSVPLMQSSGSNRDLYHAPSSSHVPLQSSALPCSSKQEKKKKWWKRRSSRSTDPGQPLRELLANWSLGEIVALVHEYETMTNEKELYIHAESSRPRAPTLRSDLADLLDFKWNSDVNLVLPPAIFPAHRAILSQRSKYFRNLLNNSSNSSSNSVTNNGIVNVNVEDTSGADIPTFSGMLRYLYTEEAPSGQRSSTDHGGEGNGSGQTSSYGHLGTLIRPSKPLESDLRDLLQTGKYSDIVLVLGDEQFAVHKPILAARSPFFRSLLQRRSNSKKIVLDDTVIPKRYARVILSCMYTDKLDLSLIEPSRSGLSEVESLTFTGKVNPSGFEEAMELYQIGRFLEFDHLCVSSEDIIVESLTHESLPQILRWSSQSHGSSWVRRQALMYVQEEYASLISTPSFLELDKHTLLEVVQSDFLQASEVEVLNSIVKWGEHQLIKRVEDREPNLVSSTRDSVFRNAGVAGGGCGDKGKERRKGRNDKISYSSDIHLNDGELREIVFDLIRCVRIDHIGLSNEFLLTAVRRGLVSIPPTHMITEEKVNPWVNTLQCPNYIRPRLYTPYYEEAKSALRSRTGGGGANSNSTECLGYAPSSSVSSQQQQSNLAYLNSLGRIKTLRPIIPDTLYMIDDGNGVVSYHTGGNSASGHHQHYHHHHHHHRHQVEDCGKNSGDGKENSDDHRKDEEKAGLAGDGGGNSGATEDGGRAAVDELVLDQEVLNAMLYREKKLRSAHLRNLSNPISRERATRYIRLRVVREFGYPDYVAELLDHHNRASLNSVVSTSVQATTTTSTTQTAVTASPTKKEKQSQHSVSHNKSTEQPKTTHHSPLYQPPPPIEFHNSNMPDVAINTNVELEATPASSSTAASSILVPFLDLDLGDNNGMVNSGEGNSSGLVRSRNRSFGSLHSEGRGNNIGHVNSLGGRVGSSSSVLVQQTYGGSLSAVGTLHHHHHYAAVASTSQPSYHYATPSSSSSAAAVTSSILRQNPVYATPQQPPQQPYLHSSIYSTAARQHYPHHHYQQPTYSTCSNSTLLRQQQQQQHTTTASSSSLLRASGSQQDASGHLTTPQSTLLRSATLQMKPNQQSTHHHHHHHGNTPPSHYL